MANGEKFTIFSVMGQIVIVMGVAGCGKSTVGKAMAHQLGGVFLEGDEFHPKENVAKMSQGEPLVDADRYAWIDALSVAMTDAAAENDWVILSCSALKRAYRDAFREVAPRARFVHLEGDFETVERRMESRTDHFMPVSLLESQFETLEPLEADEWGSLAVSIEAGPESIASEVVRRLRSGA